ncbi:unnamed protein product [Vicia faba]|uniref:Uncharacterized protein n=1 Tax=Vicia faba TaxID=3906 RepID=A0AAV1A3V9_VICFA|nr:unnamed protein product [Vicia faba]
MKWPRWSCNIVKLMFPKEASKDSALKQQSDVWIRFIQRQYMFETWHSIWSEMIYVYISYQEGEIQKSSMEAIMLHIYFWNTLKLLSFQINTLNWLRVEHMLNVLASNFLLICSIRINVEGKRERDYALSPIGKYFAYDNNGGSFGPLSTLVHSGYNDVCYDVKDVIINPNNNNHFQKVHGSPCLPISGKKD